MSFLVNLAHNAFYLVVYLTVLMVLVAAHEYGHYVFARAFGMACEEFAVGMGGRKPLIFGRRRYIVPVEEGQDPKALGESNVLEGRGSTIVPIEELRPDGSIVLHETTLFTFRPFPLGGFVRIKGMLPEEDGSEVRIPGGFFSKSPGKRWLTLAAGPLFSVLAGIVLLVPGLMLYGIDTISDKPVLGSLTRDGAANKAGLKPDDRIVSIDGVPTNTWYDVVANVRDKGTKPMHIVLNRDGRQLEKDVIGVPDDKPRPVIDPEGNPTGQTRIQTRLGSYPPSELKRLSFGESVKFGVQFPIATVVGLAERIAHPAELKDSVGGPGTMIQATAAAVDEGFWAVTRLGGLLSISVGIFNLLPFPPLDGGQMWIAFIEMLRGGRRLSMRTQLQAIKFGFTMVVLLIGSVLVIDFRRVSGIEQSPLVESGKR